MIQTILFATDVGPHTHYLLHHVNMLASQYQAKIVVLHVIELPGHLGDAVVQAYLGDEALQDFKQEGINRIAKGVKAQISGLLEDAFMDGEQGLSNIRAINVQSGLPAETILRHAADCDADMIVLGSHGHTGSPNLLGSVASKVLRMSRVPVYMVPLVRDFMAKAS